MKDKALEIFLSEPERYSIAAAELNRVMGIMPPIPINTCRKNFRTSFAKAARLTLAGDVFTPDTQYLVDLIKENSEVFSFYRLSTPVQEHIVSAACCYDGLILSLPAPARHYSIVQHEECPDSIRHDLRLQGFLTSTGRFVDREEAFLIAKEANQIIARADGNIYDGPELYSEDVW